MGASWFQQEASGRSAADAFQQAREAAAYEYGHGGYTGSLAEKDSFVVVETAGMPAQPFVQAVMRACFDDSDSPLVRKAAEIADDKWGPAACVATGDGTWVFFGYASS